MPDDLAPEDEPAVGGDGPTDVDAAPPGDEAPTGAPDAAVVEEADEAGDDESWAAQAATDGPADADEVDPAVERIEAALATVQASVDGVHKGVEGLQVGLDSTLADLAAAAREETVGVGLAELQRSLEELVRLNRRADEHVAELHSENQRLRAGELASVTLPLVRDVVRLHDEVEQLASAAAPEARDDLALVRSRLLDTLRRWGLGTFAPEVGDALDASRHNGVGAVASADGEAGTIARVRRVGFAHDDGRTFRAADVEVYRAPPPPEPTADALEPTPDAPPADPPAADPPANDTPPEE